MVSPTKSTLTRSYTGPTSTTYRHPLHLTTLPYTNTATTLEVTYDRGMTFRQRTDINSKAKTRLNVLRALTNTSFSHFKEDITQAYKQYIRPILSYAHPAWQPDTADTHPETTNHT